MATKSKSDLAQIKTYFKGLTQREFMALAPSSGRQTQSAGHEDAAEAAAKRGIEHDDASYVFWHTQAHDTAFNKAGNLTGPLYLYWGGEYDAVSAALANPPAGFAIEDNGEESAFVLRAVAKKSGKKPTGKRAIRERLDTIYEAAKTESEDRAWLADVISDGDAEFLLECFNTLHYWDGSIPKDLILTTGERVLKDIDKVVDATNEHTATDGLKRLVDGLNRIDAHDQVQNFIDAGMKSKNRIVREVVAYATQFFITEEAAKTAGKLMKMNSPIGETALESYLLIRAALDEKSVAELAVEFINDWHKFPGCTYDKSMSLHPTCLLLAAQDLSDSIGFGYVSLALNDDLSKKIRRKAFNSACRFSLDSDGVTELSRAAVELKVAKKIVAQIEAWHASCLETGEECYIQ